MIPIMPANPYYVCYSLLPRRSGALFGCFLEQWEIPLSVLFQSSHIHATFVIFICYYSLKEHMQYPLVEFHSVADFGAND